MNNQWFIENDAGKWLILNSRDAVSWNLIKDGFFEPGPGLLLKEIIPDDGIAIDVGANIGTFAIAAAKYLKNGKVYAYEAQRIVTYQLGANTLLNRLHNIYINNWAIGDPKDANSINVPIIDYSTDTNIGAVSLIPEIMNGYDYENNFVYHRKKIDKYETVPYVALDMVHEGDKIDFIKIDVEGMELLVLEGAKKIIADSMPVIFFESNNLGDATMWFKNYDYDLIPFLRDTIAFPKCGIRSGKTVKLIDGRPQII